MATPVPIASDRRIPRRILAGQARVLELLGTDREVGEVLADLCRLIEEQLPGAHCALRLFDAETGALHLTADGTLPVRVGDLLAEEDPGESGTAGARAYHLGDAVIVASIGDDGSWGDSGSSIAAAGLKAAWSIPLHGPLTGEGQDGGTPLGTLDLFFEEPREADGEDRELLSAAGELAAFVLLRTRMLAGLVEQSQKDPLTGLPNRSHFGHKLREMIERQRAGEGERFAVVALDVDQLKNINDTLGFNMGDYVLRAIGQRLVRCVRRDDVVARSSGDEFLLLLKDIQRNEDVALIAEKVRERINAPYDFDGQGLFVTSTIGIAVYPWDGEDGQTLLRNAETALAYAKDLGGSAYQLFRPTMVRNKPTFEDWWQRSKLSNDLRDALEKNQFELYYQLKFDNRGQQILGAEALIRWHHPELGLLLPGKFIPMAEQTGLIVQIGAWALETACRQNKKWQESGLKRMPVSVNVTAHQFRHSDLPQTCAEVLEKTGLEARWLELEITESLAMEDGHKSLQRLQALKNLGVRLTIDDFGTGFSSLSYLNRFPIDTLKIDQSFIRDIGTNSENDKDSQSIVRAILSIASSLDLHVVAEGVETQAQLEFLRGLGCHEIQGFLLARPKEPAGITEQLIKRS